MKRFYVYEDGVPNAPMITVFGENKKDALKSISSKLGIDFKFVNKFDTHTHCLVEDKDWNSYNFSSFSCICPKSNPMNYKRREQLNFFKDSVIRESDGELKVVYHSTNKLFDTFSLDKVVKWPGFWFTEDEDYAREHGKFIKKVYLNLKNPFNCELPENDNLLGNYMKKYGYGQEDCIWTMAFRNYLIGLGYDGMMWLHSGVYTYVAFYPNQIKSIDNMRPTNSDCINK